MVTRTEHFWDIQVDANEHLCLLDALHATLREVDERLLRMVPLAYEARYREFSCALKELDAYLMTARVPAQHAMLAAVPTMSIAGLGLANTTVVDPQTCAAAAVNLAQARKIVAAGIEAIRAAEHLINTQAQSLSSESIRAAKGYGSVSNPDHAAASMQVATTYVTNDADRGIAAQANIEPRSAVELLADS